VTIGDFLAIYERNHVAFLKIGSAPAGAYTRMSANSRLSSLGS
jgi:hypothetical protein